MKPELVDKKIMKKILKKRNKFNNKPVKKFLYKSKFFTMNFLFNYWYIILIIALIGFILYLRYQDTKLKNYIVKENMENIKVNKKKRKETLVNSETYESDYYGMIGKIQAVGEDHPSLDYFAGETMDIDI